MNLNRFVCTLSLSVLALSSARATVLYNTLVNGSGGTVPVQNVNISSGNTTWADEFLTGSSPVILSDVIAMLDQGTGAGVSASTITAYLYSNATNVPGTQLNTIATVNTSTLPTGTVGAVTFTAPTGASAITLAANTEFWIVLSGSQNAITDASWEIGTVENAAGAVGVLGQNHARFTGSWLNMPNNVNTNTIPELEVDVTSATPEPGTFAMLGAGLAGFAAMLRRRSR
jgi:hypothetical protein